MSTHLLCLTGHRARSGRPGTNRMEPSMLDVVYVLVVIAVFAVIGVVAWGVEKL